MKLIRSILDQAWTLAGAGFVLITLSGRTFRLGLIISTVALVLQVFGLLISNPEE